jgi:hypothetical protein
MSPGGELVLLAKHSGMIDDITVGTDGSIVVSIQGNRFVVDTQNQELRPI